MGFHGRFQVLLSFYYLKPDLRIYFQFSNYHILNPELKHFEILDESHGTNGDWIYGVLYKEYFEHLPRFMENSAIGHYRISEQKVGNNI